MPVLWGFALGLAEILFLAVLGGLSLLAVVIVLIVVAATRSRRRTGEEEE